MIEALRREISSMSSEKESNSEKENGSIGNSSEDLVSRLKDPDWNASMEWNACAPFTLRHLMSQKLVVHNHVRFSIANKYTYYKQYQP